MEREVFEAIVQKEWHAMPERFLARIKNVALCVEDEPSDAVRKAEGLGQHESLFGLYQGVPLVERGSEYGVMPTLPDTITLYRLPIIDEAEILTDTDKNLFRTKVELVVRETLWHEVGHYFGLEHDVIDKREGDGTNHFS